MTETMTQETVRELLQVVVTPTMTLPPALDLVAITERKQREFLAEAEMFGMTVAEYDADTTTPDPRRYGFDWATRRVEIGYDRGRFHDWLEQEDDLSPSALYTEDEWFDRYDRFVAFERKRDEEFMRLLDGHDEQMDPRLDAFV